MRRSDRKSQLEYLFEQQEGRCHICGEPALLDGLGGYKGHGNSAVRFRLGSGYGYKGRVRLRVMVHRSCAQERSDQITNSLPIDEQRARSRRWPTETYEMTDG